MTTRQLRGYLDALATGKRPRGYPASAEDGAVVRAAIALRSARPGDDAPREEFVTGLFERLSAERLSAERAADGPAAVDHPKSAQRRIPAAAVPLSVNRSGAAAGSMSLRSRQGALVAAAAAVVLVSGSVAATHQWENRGPSTPVPALSTAAVRTGSFQTTDGQVLGQVVAYRGHPSWIFMNVSVPGYEGRILCKLQVADGSVVAFGAFTMHHGVGQFSRSLNGVDVSELRGASLSGDSGATMAAATFTG
jgi:hypothetical protein